MVATRENLYQKRRSYCHTSAQQPETGEIRSFGKKRSAKEWPDSRSDNNVMAREEAQISRDEGRGNHERLWLVDNEGMNEP